MTDINKQSLRLLLGSVITILFMCLVLFGTGCRKCAKGHDEVKVVAAHEQHYTEYVKIGEISIPYDRVENIPERTYTVFVCDEYEKE